MSQHQILNPAEHGQLRIQTEAGAEYGDNVMASLVMPAEFREAQAHYPIVLRRDAETGKLAALALFGFEAGENLYLEGGHWDARYTPMAHAVQPFLIGRPAEDGSAPQVHIDMASPRVSSTGEGVRVFDDAGSPTPYLETIATMLGDLDYGWHDGADFFIALEAYGLVEPFTLEVTLDNGAVQSLVGFQTIHEERLASLDGEALEALMGQGHLARIYMILASLAQFGNLVTRKNRRIALG
ncbi:multidrug transporter [Novosphingobium fuchskuhlense]|uniref:Multidrug transporter n=1 Tax=Novosphingobium fuchskuhlense TaxID=1117702 RepID=A0A117UTX9_9SPHN|nr:SapC family protein [Novosphingobium fuchskuhlense]KUR70795.1 multidrug transporter [Novosphingobium fuchskuhlense]